MANSKAIAATCVLGLGVIVAGLLSAPSGAADPATQASQPAAYLLSSFEPGGADFVNHAGQVVEEHATDGKNALKLTSDKAAYKSLAIESGNPLAEFKKYRWLKADVFNPQDKAVAYTIKALDAAGKSENARMDKECLAPPGKSQVMLDVQAMERNGSGDIDLNKLKQISIFLSPRAEEQTLFFDNIRLEGAPTDKLPDVVLYDFEKQAEIAAWAAASATNKTEPAPKVEKTDAGVTSGKHALKITFSGGQWPAVLTQAVPEVDWTLCKSLRAEITVSRPCVVGISVRSKKGQMDQTAFLQTGKNTLVSLLRPQWERTVPPMGGKVTALAVYMYTPHDSDAIFVDNIRLADDRTMPGAAPAGNEKPKPLEFTVLGTDMKVHNVQELAGKLRDQWKKPDARSLAEVEKDFAAQLDTFKKTHPKAVLVTFRDGEKGFDPKNPDKVFDGWKDAHINSHGPDQNLEGRAAKTGKDASTELFMRHRSRLMQVDVSSIPKGSTVLTAQLVLIRSNGNSVLGPNMWVAEACNRPWDEAEVNAYQYAKDRFWQAIGGMDWGKDNDFLPVYLAYGPAQGGAANTWDFTEAVKFWADGQFENHGFFFHTAGGEAIYSPTREAKNVKDRPALMVIYEPKE